MINEFSYNIIIDIRSLLLSYGWWIQQYQFVIYSFSAAYFIIIIKMKNSAAIIDSLRFN